ncbi:MAG: hypothetical protein V5789_01730 [Colwellia sp.]
MVGIIVGLIITLIVMVVAVTAIQQNQERVAAEKRIKVTKQKAIIDENEQLKLNLANLPSNQNIVNILNRRSLNAAKNMLQLMPEVKFIKNRVQELTAQLKASGDSEKKQSTPDGEEKNFTLPESEQQLVGILQSIKKLRLVLNAEKNKGVLDVKTFTQEDHNLAGIQLKINIESLTKRGKQAFSKGMLGSARQYFEKALQSLTSSTVRNNYVTTKQAEITQQLKDIGNALKNTNAKDAENKSKDEESDVDLLFQPKKKW